MNRLLFLAAATLVASTAWSATYTLTSSNYTSVTNFTSCTVGPCANFTTSMKITGSFTVASPLAANLSNQNIAPLVTAYSFTDGITTYTNTDPNGRIYQFSVTTNASAQISNWGILLELWQSGSSPHASGDRFAFMFITAGAEQALNNDQCTSTQNPPVTASPDTCFTDTSDAARSTAGGPGGTWAAAATVQVPTLGEWGTIILTGLLVLYAWLRLRRQERVAPTA